MNDLPDHRTKPTIITDHRAINVCREQSTRTLKHTRHQYTSDLQAHPTSLSTHLLHLCPAPVPTQNCPSSRYPAAAITVRPYIRDKGPNDVICEKWHRRLETSRAAGRSTSVSVVTRCSVCVTARRGVYAGKSCKGSLPGELAVNERHVGPI